MPVTASGVEPPCNPCSQRTPVQHAGAELGAPDEHSPCKLFGCIETAILVTEDQMVPP